MKAIKVEKMYLNMEERYKLENMVEFFNDIYITMENAGFSEEYEDSIMTICGVLIDTIKDFEDMCEVE